ncbi:beta-glucosidase [Lacibacter luteus]|uniref:Beta-glucosidase n=1 Tax=Lacibacter luteus TaxID=2508719 RepID=A0A4Q1CPE6_9BACT|nr:glycoside hydrolase family 3 C-terminal domain-containing protein [Lacibacter luteus]RXK62601.1 beta-glucosidase [Lacibacter luteus]
MKYLLHSVAFLLFLPVFSKAQESNYTKAKELVSKMSFDEKIDLVVGMGMKMGAMEMPGGAPNVGQTMDKVPGAAGTTFAIPKLGLPTTVVADGPAGLRIEPKRANDANTYYATAWPVGTLLASTWDVKLVEQVGKAMGNEVKEYGVDVLLGPGMNIMRNPLGARNFEYYSEDPLVTGKIAAAMVNGIQWNGVGTSVKHFAVNNQETNRMTVDAIVSERALREIYLRGFELVVKEAKPWTVMSSYNLLNGTYTSQSYDLLTTVLRKEWGFKGMVMTDWFGGKDAVAQMKAGNDLLMPGTPAQRKAITDAINNKTLDVKVLDENATRIVAYILSTPAFKNYAFSNKPDLKQHAVVAREAAANGMVLLQNNAATLPLANAKNIAAFGNTSYDFISGGTGSGDVNEEYTVSLVEGLQNAGYTVNADLKSIYSAYLYDYKAKHPKKSFLEEFVNPTPIASELLLEKAVINSKAATSDLAIITIGRNAGEGKDRVVVNDFNLTDAEQKLIDEVSTAFHAKGKKVVVIINAGGVIEVASWRTKVDAVLLAWQPGLEAGNAVADVLSGKVNPSGKLAVTFPVKYEDEITAKNFPGKEFKEKAVTGFMGQKEIPAEVTHEEGVYVGYRYYNTFNVKPAYEFGYGLSYTNFEYKNLKLSGSSFKGKLVVTVDVTNAGTVAGKEVVQLYVTAPTGKLDKPAEELKAFGKTELLQPGQSQTLQFVIEAKQLASFHTAATAWIAEAGTYTVKVGASSLAIKQTASFTVAKEILVEKCNKVLAPAVTINELKK